MMDDALKQLLNLGRGYFEKRQYAEAEDYLTQVVDQNQSFADVYNMLGVIYHQQGQFARAQRSFESALRLNPTYTDAALNLAVIYNDLGKYKEAKEIYASALTRHQTSPLNLDPFVSGKIANMYADIGNAFASSGMLEQAAFEYRRALALGPSFVDIRVRLANTLRDLHDYAASLQEFEIVLKENPHYEPGRVQYGLALFAAGKRGDAISVWEAVLRQNPSNKSAQMYLNLVRDMDPQSKSAVQGRVVG